MIVTSSVSLRDLTGCSRPGRGAHVPSLRLTPISAAMIVRGRYWLPRGLGAPKPLTTAASRRISTRSIAEQELGWSRALCPCQTLTQREHHRVDLTSPNRASLTAKIRWTLLEVRANAFFVILRGLERPTEPLVERDRLLETQVAPEIHHCLHCGEPKWAAALHRLGELQSGLEKLAAGHDAFYNAEPQSFLPCDPAGGKEDFLS